MKTEDVGVNKHSTILARRTIEALLCYQQYQGRALGPQLGVELKNIINELHALENDMGDKTRAYLQSVLDKRNYLPTSPLRQLFESLIKTGNVPAESGKMFSMASVSLAKRSGLFFEDNQSHEKNQEGEKRPRFK